MDLSTVGIRLAAGALTPLIKKLFQSEGPGAGLVERDRELRISSYVAWREKRGLGAADLRGLADDLVRQALRLSGERPLPPDEEAGVATALAVTLNALGDLALSDLEAVRLGHRAFARKLRAAAPPLGLSRDAELFHARLVDVACLHILNFFTQRSTFVAATLVEQSRSIGDLAAKTDEVLTRIPRQEGRDAPFERRYLAYVAQRHSALTIFGLDLAPGSARWPLDAAYVNLAATATGAGPGYDSPSYSLPADQLLTEHHRVLLRGEAGSGKTTLSQWLAVSAARGEGGDQIPFVLPLRSLTRHGGRLPAADALLTGTSLAGEAPEGWANRVLRDGRALLLVDGIDEVPESERRQAREWLSELITAYGDNRWLVTSRPSAVRRDWLVDLGFAEVTLAPMTPPKVRSFIERWHTAAEHVPAEYKQQLLDAVRTKPDLARLATNPLLCGLICALHRERRGYLPSGRKELYAAALSMLLHRRDHERGLRLPELAEEPQLQLLQRLAYWLIRNGRGEMERERAEALIADALPAVPAARVLGEPPAVFQHFLERTGLLRAPTEDTVEIVHRTFQDFLGARAALDEGSFGELAGHAGNDQWEDVIRMAVAQGRPRDRTEIIRALLDQGSERAVLLALASLEYAAELDPALRAEVEAAAEHLVPPTNLEAAYALGRVGPLALDLLRGPGAEPDAALAFYTVVAAGSVGSDLAIPLLARYAPHDSALVQGKLVEFWPLFDTRQYAEEVIARLPRIPETLTVHSDAELDALGEFAPQERLTVAGDVSHEALARYRRRTPITSLSIRDNERLTSLGFLRGDTSLRVVSIMRCPALTDLARLTGLPVERAHLQPARSVDVGAVTVGWSALRELSLGADADWSPDDLAPEASLRTLVLTGPPRSLTGLARHQALRILRLPDSWVPADADWRAIASLEKLRELTISRSALGSVPGDLRLPFVRTLRFHGRTREDRASDARAVQHFPRAETTSTRE
ncbi:NACHT domain-containing protein [Streptomyces sp. NPDC059989]|uniref:NACHT domain-containing protein n=1 Tax=Streptomyces sp. NPDC059989 TaxID=3347026 RepID=UPI0036871004